MTILLIISYILLHTSYSLYRSDLKMKVGRPPYLKIKIITLLPKSCGFIISVIPLTILTEYEWYYMFLINAIITIISPVIITFIYKIFFNQRESSYDMLYSSILGITTLILSFLFK